MDASHLAQNSASTSLRVTPPLSDKSSPCGDGGGEDGGSSAGALVSSFASAKTSLVHRNACVQQVACAPCGGGV